MASMRASRHRSIASNEAAPLERAPRLELGTAGGGGGGAGTFDGGGGSGGGGGGGGMPAGSGGGDSAAILIDGPLLTGAGDIALPLAAIGPFPP